MKIIRYLGESVLRRFTVLSSVWEILLSSFLNLIFRFHRGRKATLRVLLKQIYFTGFEAIPIVSWIAIVLGLIIVTQSLSILPRFGGEGLIGEIFVWVVIREVGPVFASVIVIARSGTAIASELGSMKISKEITSLEVMGIDPIHYLITPRVIGTGISVLLLTFYFEAVSILGGYLLAGFGKNISFSVYTQSILEAMGFLEIGVSLLKSLLFGLIIGAVCSYHGLMAEKSITQIPQQTTKAVIGSLRLVFVMDAVITFVFFM
ncbi:MAG: ABC transporter permease [Deltaproteobacteria bacterium]|nr:ABC transporter permease [Deltaproteobacteria bacterium]